MAASARGRALFSIFFIVACRVLPRPGGLGFGRAGAQLLPEDVVLVPGPQVAAVVRGGEAAVGDPHDSGQGPVPQVVLTWRISAESAVLPGQHQTRTPSRLAAIPITTRNGVGLSSAAFCAS